MYYHQDISIHAPLAGCDGRVWLGLVIDVRISIHAPLAGCDSPGQGSDCRSSYFNPRTPCGVRLPLLTYCTGSPNFNPRTPCGVRLRNDLDKQTNNAFQSTHPLRGATCTGAQPASEACISIHAPLAGCDQTTTQPPRGERPFQSTHPLRGATRILLSRLVVLKFQSTHPLRGATVCNSFVASAAVSFQSTHPLRGATHAPHPIIPNDRIFQSTHPLRGATNGKASTSGEFQFQSTHPLRGATLLPFRKNFLLDRFQSTHPLRGATTCIQGVLTLG